MQGVVKHFNAERAFGFIGVADTNSAGQLFADDWYFHRRDVAGEVRWGDVVEFWLVDSPKGGMKAAEVKRLVPAEQSQQDDYPKQHEDRRRATAWARRAGNPMRTGSRTEMMNSIEARSGDSGAGIRAAPVHPNMEAARADTKPGAIQAEVHMDTGQDPNRPSEAEAH